MAFPASKRAHTRKDETELNLTPIMNIFVILVPFLLLTAVFAQTAVLNLSLPSGDEDGEDEASLQEEPPPKLMISITGSGFLIGAIGGLLPEIPKTNNDYDFGLLEKKLMEIKGQFPEQVAAVIISEPEILYDNIIQLMDVCIKTGFVDISLARGIVMGGEGQ